MEPIGRKVLLVSTWVLLALISAKSTSGVEVLIVGNAQNPWEAMGTMENIDTTTDPGWMQPRRTEATENLSLGAQGRGGGMSTPQPSVRQAGNLNNMIDGDVNTVFDGSRARQVGGRMDLDLGSIFGGVERIRFYPSPTFSDKFLKGYEVYINDGSAEMQIGGVLQWTLVEKAEKNTDSTVQMRIPSQYVRHVRIVFTTPLPWEIAELEVYSRGFVPRANYTSEVIDLGGLANFGQLKWAAEEQPRASVHIFTRTGATPDPLKYYQLKEKGLKTEQTEVSADDYNSLKEAEREKGLDAENWSPWSPVYTRASGEQVAFVEPRRYFQFKCEFASDFFTQGARLDSLAFEFSTPPVARFIWGEVGPLEVNAGEPTLFTYVVRAKIEESDTGFDALEIATPSRATIEELKIGGTAVADFVQEIEDDRMVIRFPNHRVVDTTPVELSFEGAVLVYGTRFTGKVFDTQTAELPQPITAGDTSPDLPNDDLAVAVSLGETIVAGGRMVPNPFTPNGDGVNDLASIHYQILKLTKEVPITVAIYDLSGRLVRDLYSGTDVSGIYALDWDGLDNSGRLVVPGLYLSRISVDADRGEGDKVALIAVVY